MSEADVGAPAPPTATPPASRRTRRIELVLLAVVIVVAAVLTARLFVWPELAPLPAHADAIIQLGGPGNRRIVALNLAHQGRAPVVAISVSDDEINTSWCHRGEFDGVSVICFHSDPFTTRGEAHDVAELAQQHGWHSIILVTTPDQAWRASVRVGRCYPGEITVATARLPWYRWPIQIEYQWAATVKAYTIETTC
jgi:uncharacterized SAM-binding protein YcdF (DUF218 family)